MRERINEKGRMKDDDHAQADCHDEPSERVPDPPGNEQGKNNSSTHRPPGVMVMLMRDQRRSAKVSHVVVVGAVAPEKDPADVRVPESLIHPVRVVLSVGEAMVLTMLRRPFQRGLF